MIGDIVWALRSTLPLWPPPGAGSLVSYRWSGAYQRNPFSPRKRTAGICTPLRPNPRNNLRTDTIGTCCRFSIACMHGVCRLTQTWCKHVFMKTRHTNCYLHTWINGPWDVLERCSTFMKLAGYLVFKCLIIISFIKCSEKNKINSNTLWTGDKRVFTNCK